MTDEQNMAWEYHKNADYMQHQRHTIFLLAETFLFLAFVQPEEPFLMRAVLALLGFWFAVLWRIVAERLEARLEAMRKILLKAPAGEDYWSAAQRNDFFSGRGVFNKLLPVSTALGWILLFIIAATRG